MHTSQFGSQLGPQPAQHQAAWRRLRKSCMLVSLLSLGALAGCGTADPEQVEPTTQELKRFPAPTLLAPADGAALTEARPSFSWQPGRGPAHAILELCADSRCAVSILQLASKNSEKTRLEQDLAAGTYYWRVAHVAGRSKVSEWSAIRRFEIVPIQPVITADLFGVYSAGVQDVWTVGAAGTILHYDGAWHVETSPTSVDLRSVWAATGGHAWAVGAGGTILHRNGSGWALAASPTTENLWGVWGSSSSDVWAAGDAGLILHFDGTSWTVSHNRMAGSLRAVWGSGPGDVWVVGSGREPDGDYAALTLHWNGSMWSESYLCNPEGTRFASGGWVAGLSDVWGQPGATRWAAGQCQSGASFIPYGFVAQNSGTGWSDTPGFGFGEPLGKYRPLQTIWSSSDSDVWAASAVETVAGTTSPPTMLHFDGNSWTPSPQSITAGIRDLGGTASSDVWAVGKAGKRLHYDGTLWSASL